MNAQSHGNSINNNGNLVALLAWLSSVGVQPVTAWRWRRKGWLTTVNICGRLYITRETIAEFERRAMSGEFAKESKSPRRKSAPAELAAA